MMDKLFRHYKNMEEIISGNLNDTRTIPLSFQINITNKCYQKCLGCRKYEWPNVKLDFQTVKNMIEWLASKGADSVVLSGGEPTAHPDFIKILEVIKQNGLGVRVITSAMWPAHLDLGYMVTMIDFMTISIDGADKDIYEKCRGIDSLDIITKNIEKLNVYKQKLNPDLKIRCSATISNVNLYDMNNIFDLCNRLKFDECNFYPMHTWNDFKVSNLTEQDVIKAVTDVESYTASVKSKMKTNISSFVETMSRKKPPICIVPWLHAFVDANGDVFYCCRTADDNGSYDNRNEDYIIGNIIKEPIEKVWNSQRAMDLRKRLYEAKEPMCYFCDRYNGINHAYFDYLKSKSDTKKIYL